MSAQTALAGLNKVALGTFVAERHIGDETKMRTAMKGQFGFNSR